MHKALTYTSFGIASLVVVLTFLTTKTYAQLSVATLLYLPLAYFALKIFPRKTWKLPTLSIKIPEKPAQESRQEVKLKSTKVADIDKRASLKLIVTAGISFFLFSLLGRRETPFFGKFMGSGDTLKDTRGRTVDPAERQPTDGYKIAEIDDNEIAYYGFTNKDRAWFIMKEDTTSNSFRYAKGDLDFPNNWSKRKQLNYDYYYNVFK